jgi:hypothetical protein
MTHDMPASSHSYSPTPAEPSVLWNPGPAQLESSRMVVDQQLAPSNESFVDSATL